MPIKQARVFPDPEVLVRWLDSIRLMPLPVLGLTLVFLSVPLASCFLFETPVRAFDRFGWAPALSLFCAYWACPLAIAYSLLARRHWFLPLYLGQCALLAVHTILARDQASELQLARLVVVGLMIYVGVLMGNRNFLYPLLTRSFRSWRRSVRFRVGRAVTIRSKHGATAPALLIDCAVSGIQLSVHSSDLPHDWKSFAKGEKLTVEIPPDAVGVLFDIPLDVAWVNEVDGSRRFGCRGLDRAKMKNYVQRERAKQKSLVQLPVPRGYTIDQDIQETALVLWLACIALSFLLPALG